ncbi:hypothetical protein PybrP1_007854 [[Pythium] brassicae (nom. inval.)]|nr:hypothetical protein PybrP1_007854 [[Pythium] brassicae (nom. inval.)]
MTWHRRPKPVMKCDAGNRKRATPRSSSHSCHTTFAANKNTTMTERTNDDGRLDDFGFDQASLEAAIFDSSAAATEHLRASCHTLGFALKKRRDNKKQTKDEVSAIYYLRCGRAGDYKNSRPNLTESTRVRKTKTTLCGCRFEASVRALDKKWVIYIDSALHNHDPVVNLTALRHARILLPAHASVVKTMANTGVSVKTILAAIKATDPTALLTDRDILNARRNLRITDLAERTEMQALMDELRSESIRHAIQTASDGSLTHRLIQPADTVELTKEFQEVVYMDSTYRTNRYSMPLLHVVGQTNTGKSFTIALCFMRTEKSADYL